jgi:hypothetical protein
MTGYHDDNELGCKDDTGGQRGRAYVVAVKTLTFVLLPIRASGHG